MALPAQTRSPQPDLPRLLRQASRAHREGALVKAERLYSAVLEQRPDDFDALHLLGLLKYQRGDLGEAIRLMVAALRISHGSVEAWSNLGLALHAQGRLEEALRSYDAALGIRADPDVLNNRGTTLHRLGRGAEAMQSFAEALALRPRFVEALYNQGNTLLDLGRPREALASFDQALKINPRHPESLCLRGNALLRLGDLPQAAQAYAAALQVDARRPQILHNYAHVLRHLGHPELALAHTAKVLALDSGHVGAWFGHSLALLTLGDFANGWKAYEWRWQTPEMVPQRRAFSVPLWLGAEPLAGKTVLLHAEQGWGDTLQFVRYIPMVAERGAKVLLEVPSELATLMTTVRGAAAVLVRGTPLPHFDLHCPLASLPLAFGTQIDTIPARVPYLVAPEDKAAVWRERLAPGTLRVGLTWSGRASHGNDRNRSIALARFAPLLDVPGVRFVSLQREVREEDAAALRAMPSVIDVSAELHSFADTAAVISALDIIVSVDTSVAHLAGALGKPLFLLLPAGCDFRWLREREDSPWYPTARLFRQPRYGDWDSVIARVRTELGVRSSGRG